jgi:hypothetical protein
MLRLLPLVVMLTMLLTGCGGGGGGTSPTTSSTETSTTAATTETPTPAPAATPTPAPAVAQLGGRLLDARGRPLAGLSVTASPPAAKQAADAVTVSVTTDANGGFSLTDLVPDTVYSVTISGGAGLSTITTEFQVPSGVPDLQVNLTVPAGTGSIHFSLPAPLQLAPPTFDGTVGLSWNRSSDPRFAAYTIFRAGNAAVDTSSTQIAAISDVSETTVEDETALAQRPPTAYYRLFEKDWVTELNGFVEVGSNLRSVVTGGPTDPLAAPQDYHQDTAFATSDLGSLVQPGIGPENAAFVVDRQGSVLVPATYDNGHPETVYRFDADGVKIGEMTLDGVSLGIDAQNDIWACQAMDATGRLTHYDSSGTLLESFDFQFPDEARLSGLCQLAVDRAHSVAYVTQPHFLEPVVQVDLSTSTAQVPPPLQSLTLTMTTDDRGVLYGANNAWSIQKFDSALSFLGLISTSGVPACVTLGGDGQLYVAAGSEGSPLITRNDPETGAPQSSFLALTSSSFPSYVFIQADAQSRVYVKFPDVPFTRWVPNAP